ncbi:Inner membrane metabolite transport protein YdjE [Methylobacterium crusticola]|uniref:Inner membrane metabolite transport protein YdjE n=1 Tax=Methylobacterium crusticola TaxID=1697972 RepID=A0ABQ4R4U0_9HYPH|nr:MFS transporter [Methylobacterium crusticola]GJD52145.1 Inner membrane metabolite transport protein YdjE [Methylobacterium crusticola]
MAQVVNAGARLDRLPIARFHWRILGLIGAGAALDAFDIYLAGGVIAAMLKEGFSTQAQNATFVSATFAGMLIGAGLAGYVGDRYGRRASYQFNLGLFGLASLAACLAPDIAVLTLCRFVMGIGLGAELVVAAGTLCEFVPPAYRGRWIAILGILTNSGLFVATSVGYLVIPALGWRAMFAIAGVGAIAIWLLRKRMPESPRWLEAVGRPEEAERTLRAIEAEVGAGRALPPVATVRSLAVPAAPVTALFRPGMIGRTTAAALTCMAVNISVYGFVAWLPTFLVRQGMSVVQSLGFTTLMSLGSIAGALVGMALGDRISRQRSLVGTCLAIMALGVVYATLREPVEITVVGFCLVTSIYTLVTLGLYGYIPELFPTHLRLRGTGVAGMCGRAASIATPFLVVGLFEAFGLPGVLGLVGCVLAALVAAILVLRVETGGVSLDDAGSPPGRREAASPGALHRHA